LNLATKSAMTDSDMGLLGRGTGGRILSVSREYHSREWLKILKISHPHGGSPVQVAGDVGQ
jgi:hypothetical protein